MPYPDTQIILFEGFDELDVIGPFEVLRKANFDVKLVTLGSLSNITGAHGLTILPHALFDVTKKPDLLIVPGGGWIAHSNRGARAEIERGEIPKIISQLHQQQTIIASVCTGAMLLAAAGLLTGRPATTNHAAFDDLKNMGIAVVDARVVDDGDIITAGGVTAGLDLALWLIERFTTPENATAVEHALEYQRRSPIIVQT